MLFNSFTYAAFLPVVFLLYWSLNGLKQGVRAQNLLLLLASWLFYGFWDWRFLGLLWLSTAVDFFVGRALGVEGRAEGSRRRIMLISVCFNLGLLATFKYFNFFADTLRTALQAVGLPLDLGTLEVILPVGISFYTFQSLGYIVDVYRRVIPPARSALDFAAFVSFFPQLVAGPISRADVLLSQFPRPRVFTALDGAEGLRQLLWGLTKKVVVADNLAPTVERFFQSPGSGDGLTLIAVLWLFTVQLYCDFSGYSDMATGSARLLGFKLARNFDFPLFSRSLNEFWRRWHISFNSWMRDFVYVPLETATRRRFIARRKALKAANRPVPGGPSAWETTANIVLVFTLSGLWHGAAWTYVLWGFLNGCLLVPSALRRPTVESGVVAAGRLLPGLLDAGRILRTNALIAFTLLFFRASDLEASLTLLISGVTTPVGQSGHGALVYPLCLASAPLLVEWFARAESHGLAVARWPLPGRWAVYAALWLCILTLGSVQSRDFVYFQF